VGNHHIEHNFFHQFQPQRRKAMKTTLLFAVALVCWAALPFSATAEPLKVFVSIPPQKWLTDKIGGELVQTSVLVGKGADPHSFEPSPKQLFALSGASLYFTVGIPFEKQLLHKITRTAAGVRFVDTSLGVSKIPMVAHHHEEGHGHDAEHHEHHAEKEHHGEDHDHHKDKGHHEQHHNHHQGDGLDPHIWLSPVNLKIMAQTMTKAIIKADPANTNVYKANLETILAELDQQLTTISKQLNPFKGATFYVFHPAFGYFARDFHLHQEAVEIEGKSPTPKQLSRLIAMAKQDQVKVIFVQPQFDKKSAEAVAAAIGGRVVPLNPLAEDVGANLTTMAEKIAAALQ
jgi:zinc transport system substrate-binding protein